MPCLRRTTDKPDFPQITVEMASLLGSAKRNSATVRYLGIEVDDALAISEKVEI